MIGLNSIVSFRDEKNSVDVKILKTNHVEKRGLLFSLHCRQYQIIKKFIQIVLNLCSAVLEKI